MDWLLNRWQTQAQERPSFAWNHPYPDANPVRNFHPILGSAIADIAMLTYHVGMAVMLIGVTLCFYGFLML